MTRTLDTAGLGAQACMEDVLFCADLSDQGTVEIEVGSITL